MADYWVLLIFFGFYKESRNIIKNLRGYFGAIFQIDIYQKDG